MDKMIISILSALGLGINGVVSRNPNIYASRLGEFIRGFNISLLTDNGTRVVFEISDKDKSYILSLELRGEKRSIKDMTLTENNFL